MVSKLPPPKRVIAPVVRRKVRARGALPTHNDRCVGPTPEQEREERRRKVAAVQSMRDRIMAGFSRAVQALGIFGGYASGGLLEPSNERWNDPPPAPGPPQLPNMRRLLTASGFEETITPTARRIGLTGSHADLYDAVRFGTLYSMGSRRLANALVGHNSVRSIERPGVTEYEQALRLASAASRFTSSTIRLGSDAYVALSAQLSARSGVVSDNVSPSVTLSGIPIILDETVPAGQIVMHQQPVPVRFMDFERAEDILAYPQPNPLTAEELRPPPAWANEFIAQEMPTIRNDERQTSVPHARFLEENARFSRRRRR